MKISSAGSQGSRGGFTLIELIIVLVIIGIASGLAGVIISRSSGNFELKKFAKALSVDLRYARNRAITEKKTYCFVIDKNERRYNLYTDKKNDDEDSDEKFIRVIDKSVPGELEMTLRGSELDSQFIEFFPGGNSTGGIIEVSNQKGAVYNIIVNRITGKVTAGQGEG